MPTALRQALAMALALRGTGKIVTCDISCEYVDVARRFWDEAGVSNRIEAVIGDAKERLMCLVWIKYCLTKSFHERSRTCPPDPISYVTRN